MYCPELIKWEMRSSAKADLKIDRILSNVSTTEWLEEKKAIFLINIALIKQFLQYLKDHF